MYRPFFTVLLAGLLTPHAATAQSEMPASPSAESPAAPPVAAPPVAAPPDGAETSSKPAAEIRFNFKGATWDQALDYFSRLSGLPIVREVPAPDGTVDYLSSRVYSLPEALQTLNILLQTRGVMLRREDDRLFLQKLEDMKREDIPTFVGRLPEDVTSDQIVTVVVPLLTAQAKPVAEQLSQMVASYGSVSAMEKQNALVLVETAAQVRRLQRIIDELDREDVENVVEFIPIQHANAEDLVKSLTALIGERTIEYVINPANNQRVKLDENKLAGLTIAADARTNAIIGRGTRAKLDQLKETIALLDVPGSAESRSIKTFRLNRLTTTEAAQHLEKLFAGGPTLNANGRRRPKEGPKEGVPSPETPPVIIRQDNAAKITVVGSDSDIADAAALLAEIDGPSSLNGETASVAVVPLRNVKAESAISAAAALSGRQDSTTLRMVAGLDGKSVLVAGPDGEVEGVKAMLAALDQPSSEALAVRVVRVEGANASEYVERAKALFAAQADRVMAAELGTVDFDKTTSMLTLVGSEDSLSRFASILDQVRGAMAPASDVRVLRTRNVKPSTAAAFLQGLAAKALGGGSAQGPIPTFDAIDASDLLIVTAEPSQQQIIAQVLQTFDVPADHEVQPLRIFQLRTADSVSLAATLNANYNARPSSERTSRPVSISADAQTNMLLVAAHPDVLPEIEGIVSQLNDANRVDAEGREIRIFPLKVARAESLARTIDDMFPEPPVPVDPRGRPRPELQKPREVVVRADAQTNSLIVDAPVQRMTGFEKLVESLDRQEIAAETEVRTYRLQHADLGAVSQTLRQLADQGNLGATGGARRANITISMEPLTQTLIVSGPSEIFGRVDDVLKSLDTRKAGPTTSMRLFKLQRARADQLAPMMREILTARIAEDVPDAGLNAASLLTVTTDRATNTLIISAPEALMPAAAELIKQLDSETTAVGSPVIRVHPLTFADASDVSQTLSQALPNVLSKSTGNPLDVRLIASPGSNAIIMVGPEADLAEVDAMVTPLDARPSQDAIDAKTFELKFAEAGQIAPIVQTLLNDQQDQDPRIVLERIRRSRGQLDLTPKIRVEADHRTNSLIVSGPQRLVALANTLITELDRPDEGSTRTYASFTPANADPSALSEATKRVVAATQSGGTRSTLELLPDAQSGAILIIGTKDEVDRATAFMKQRDAESLALPQVDLAILPLTHADAKAIAPVMSALLQDRSRWPAKLAAAAKAGLTIAQPTATADPSANRLLISAPSELTATARDLVAQIDQPAKTGVQETRLLSLKVAKADQAANAIRVAMEARTGTGSLKPAIASDPSSNSLIVTASPETLSEIEKLVASMDEGQTPDQMQVRTVFLKFARAESVAPLVTDLLAEKELLDVNDLPNWARVDYIRSREQGASGRPPFRVTADARLNAIIVSGPSAALNTAEQMIAQLDVDPGSVNGSGDRSIRVLTIRNANAGEIAETLSALFDDEATEQRPTIRVNEASNSLIVRASARQFATIDEVVRKIDDATIASGRELRTIPIDRSKADAKDVAEMLKRMLQKGQDGSKVEVITIDELLKKVSLSRPRSAEGVGGLAGVLAMAAMGQTESGGEPQPELTIAVDEATNSLVVVGSDRSLDRLMDLARQLQEQMPSAPGKIRYIALPEGTDAERIRALASETMRQLAPAGGKPGDVAKRTAIVADAAGGGLLIAADDTDFELIGSLVATLAKSGTPERLVVKIYPLTTITADRAAGSIRALIGSDGRGRSPRVRDMAMTLVTGDASVEAVIDPSRMKVTSDAINNAVIVMGDPDAIAFMDRFVEMIDQTPINTQSTLRLFPLKNARASELSSTLRNIFRARHRNLGGGGQGEPEFAADERTNTLVVTAEAEQLAEVDGLIAQLDVGPANDRRTLKTITLNSASADQAAEIVNKVVIGTDPSRRSSTLIVSDTTSGVLLVRATDEVLTEIEQVIREIDREATSQFEVRTLTLQHADASTVATVLQKFFDDRARLSSVGRNRREQGRRVTIVGDMTSATLLVAASDEDFEEVKTLVERFDSAEASQAMAYRVYPLKNAKAGDIEQTLQRLIDDLTWSESSGIFMPWMRQGQNAQKDAIAIRAEPRLNSIIVTGRGDRFDVAEQMIEMLDAPLPEGDKRLVRLYVPRNTDVNVMADLIRDAMGDTSGQQRWFDPSPAQRPKVRVDDKSGTIIVSATAKEHDEISSIVSGIESRPPAANVETSVMQVEFGRASELGRTLRDFLVQQARSSKSGEPEVAIVASESANTLLVSGTHDEISTVRDLLTRLDQPATAGDRVIDILGLKDGRAPEVARLVSEQFRRSGGQGGQGVVVTADARTNSVIVNAPTAQFEQVKALIERLDSPSESAVTIIRTYALANARAEEAVRILGQTLQLDSQGKTSGITIKLDDGDSPPVEVKARIVADTRSNSLVITATNESFPVIESLVNKLEAVPASSPVEYRVISLAHALAPDVAYTLRQLLPLPRNTSEPEARIDYNRLENQLVISATTDQFQQIDAILKEIDQPSATKRTTDFVPLKFAKAEKVREALSYFYGQFAADADTPGKQNVRIIADPASNSLVISADEAEWEGIRGLLAKLDREDYDTSLQLRVMPLTYSDARSVARAITEAFQGAIRQQQSSEQERRQPTRRPGDEQRPDVQVPAALVKSEEWVSAAAEPQTNSVIVSASLSNIRKIEQIISQLDVPESSKLPPPQLIPVRSGNPTQLAEAISKLYAAEGENRSTRALRIIGDVTTNTLIVRAEESDFAQVKALADALQQQSSSQGLGVHVLKLTSAPAARIASAVEDAFAAKAKQSNLPLSITVDAAGNNLVVASTGPMYDEIVATVQQMDAMAPAAGQGIFIIELENISPEAARHVVERIGLDKAPTDQSTSRIVVEPIKVSTLAGRNAIVVVANPGDRDTIVALMKAIDAEPKMAEAQLRVFPLKNAKASALASLLNAMLAPDEGQQQNSTLSRAMREQIRRLNLRRDGADQPDVKLDLAKPIRIQPDDALNALIVSSTPENVGSIEQVIGVLDQLPITEAVTVQIFPLENISAREFGRIVKDLFSQGKQLNSVPGVDLKGMPAGTVGRALLDEVALSIDERSNTVVVAGKEESVAFVQVLRDKIDSGVTIGWVEPRLIPLRFADATDLATTINDIVVNGATNLPQSTPIQQQIGRLRMARSQPNGQEAKVIEADVFQPMTQLLVKPEPQMNALVCVGTPANLDVVEEFVRLLDVEASAPENSVRIYPLSFASAAKVAQTVGRLFDQQAQLKAIRPEDRVFAQADERTNALVVTTSPRSFAVLEGLLKSLDQKLSPELREIRTIELKNAAASRLASMIQQMMDARLDRLRKIQPETADLDRVVVVADTRVNSLVVAAGNETFEVVKRLAEDLDQPLPIDNSAVTVIPMTKGNADRIARAVQEIMERRYADLPGDVNKSMRPLVLTDSRTNSLLVAANPEDQLTIADLVRKLEDVPGNPAVGLHVIPLATGRAETLAPRLQNLMRERRQSLGESASPSDQVSIQADAGGNTLIVAASDENAEMVQGLVEALSKAEAEAIGGQNVEIVTLTTAKSTEIVPLLEEMYVNEENRKRGAGTVRVTADQRLNAVLLSGSVSDINALKSLTRQLDGAPAAAVVEIKYIPLTSANALETVSLIENVLAGRNLAGRRLASQATVLKYLKEYEDESGNGKAEMEVSTAIRETINLTPDLRTNTIIISAPREAMAMIERMIKDLDGSNIGAQRLRIFKLTNADAEATATILSELFNLKRQGNLMVLKPREDVVSGVADGLAEPPALAGLSGTDLTAVPDERQQLSITVDSRTNSLLVSATPNYLDLVEQVVSELDAQQANERETYVYRLKNAVAAEVAEVVSKFVQEDQKKLIETLSTDQLPSAARLLEREVTIVGDEKSNTVLVNASPRYMEQVKLMIEELDIDPPQVLIQVLLAEITLDSSDEWGVDFNFAKEVGATVVTGGYGLASAFVTGMGVPNIAVAGEDFNLLIRAMQSQGRLNVLSNPSIMTANNEEAQIQIGETVRLPESTSFEGGSQQSSVEPEDIGVILKVTPSINPDGFVRMDINPEISSLSARTTRISEDFESPIITRRKANTTVTIKDGQTVVIGGLISSRYERRDEKVPLLGDLPIFGPLFRAETTEQSNTELLIVLTPHVIMSPAGDRVEDMRILSRDEIDRLSIPETIKDQIRRGALYGNESYYDKDGNPIVRPAATQPESHP